MGRLAVVAGALCVLDCTVLPLVTGLASVAGLPGLDHELVHAAIHRFVLPVVLLALGTGHWRHRDGMATLVGAAGLALLLTAHHVEVPLVALSGSLMIFASQRMARRPSGPCCASRAIVFRPHRP